MRSMERWDAEATPQDAKDSRPGAARAAASRSVSAAMRGRLGPVITAKGTCAKRLTGAKSAAGS